MMNLNLEELSIEQIESKIQELKSDILDYNEENYTEYSLELLSSMDEKEIKAILDKHGLSDQFNELKEYISVIFLFSDEAIYSQFSKTLNPIIEKANYVVGALNKEIKKKLDEIKKHNENIEKELVFYEELKKYLSGDFSFEKDDYDKLINFIIKSDITDEQKVKLSLLLSKKLIDTKVNKVSLTDDNEDAIHIDSFEEDLENEESANQTETKVNISQYRKIMIEYADRKYLQYKSIISNNTFGNPENVYGIFTLDDIDYSELSTDMFAIMLIVSVFSIKDMNVSDREISKFTDVLKNIDDIYDNIIKHEENKIKDATDEKTIQEEFDKITKKLNVDSLKLERLFALSSTHVADLGQNVFNSLIELQQKIEEIKTGLDNQKLTSMDTINEINNKINNIEASINRIDDSFNSIINGQKTIEPIEIKTFILFDVDDESKKTYFYEDMLGDNPFIEQQAIVGNDVSQEDANYQKSISKFIKEIMLYGKSEYMMSVNSSAENYSDRVESIIYKKNKSGKVNRDEKTPLWRMRPSLASNIRFIERKVVIPKNSELLSQVKELIQKHLPNVIIDENEDFTMMVNLGCGIKRADTDIYSTAYRRFKERDVKPLSIFYEDGNYGKKLNKAIKLKNRLSEDDCKVLELFIVNSLQSLYEMNKKETLYDFSFIDRMGGDKKHGL